MIEKVNGIIELYKTQLTAQFLGLPGEASVEVTAFDSPLSLSLKAGEFEASAYIDVGSSASDGALMQEFMHAINLCVNDLRRQMEAA